MYKVVFALNKLLVGWTVCLKAISLETDQDGGHKSIGKVDKNVSMGEISEEWTSSGIL